MLTARLSLPIVMGIFIDWFSDPLSQTIPKLINPEVDGYIWAALFSSISFIYGLTMAPAFHLQMVQGRGYIEPSNHTAEKQNIAISRTGHHLRVQACSLLYKKILRLNSFGMSKVSIGKLINLMSNDASRYEMFMINCAQVGVPYRNRRTWVRARDFWALQTNSGSSDMDSDTDKVKTSDSDSDMRNPHFRTRLRTRTRIRTRVSADLSYQTRQ